MDYLYTKELNEQIMSVLRGYAKFEVEDDVLLFKKLDHGLCSAIEEDLGVSLTVLFQCPENLKMKIKSIRSGMYQVSDLIIELIRNQDYDFSFEIPQDLDYTIQSFLNNSMSVNKTANELYLHRNSLQYRLKKFKQITGLDVKKFRDAFAYELYNNFVQTANR